MNYELLENGNVKIGEKAPDFEAISTFGKVSLKDYEGKWLVLFSHPGDFTPVCTTEMIAFTRAHTYFKQINTELLGLSVDSNSSHLAWAYDIYCRTGIKISFPIIADRNALIARRYGIPPRTVSRELEKLKDDEYYQPLYRIGKEHSERKMKRKPFTSLETYLIDNTLSGFDEGDVIIDDSIPKAKLEYLKQKKILERADSIEGTNKDKAKVLGISVSTLRRMRIKVAEYEKLEEQKDGEGKEDR